MSSDTSASIEEVKQKILSGIREEWAVPELKESQLTHIDTLTHGWRSHIILASMASQSELDHSPRTVVVKTFNSDTAKQALNDEERKKKLLLYFKREAGIWRKIGSHPNIAEISAFMESFNGSILPAIVSPYYPRRDLRRFVENDRSITVAIRLSLTRDVARGLEYLHSLTPQVVHRDIKGSNILVKESGKTFIACISDFGSAKFLDQTGIDMAYTTMMTSIQWTPPEFIINGQPSYTNPTPYGDIWSFGCTLLETLKGSDPWGQDDRTLSRLKARRHPPRPSELVIDDAVWSIMEHCWNDEPEARIDASGIALYMNMLLD